MLATLMEAACAELLRLAKRIYARPDMPMMQLVLLPIRTGCD